MPQDLYRFYLLERRNVSHTGHCRPIDHGELMISADHSIRVIEDAARDVINERLGLPSTVDIELDVYQATRVTHSGQTLTYGSSATTAIWR